MTLKKQHDKRDGDFRKIKSPRTVNSRKEAQFKTALRHRDIDALTDSMGGDLEQDDRLELLDDGPDYDEDDSY